MSVFTLLETAVLVQYLSDMGLTYVESQPVHGGMENTIYRVTVSDQAQIQNMALVLFERLSSLEAQRIPKLLAALYQLGFPVAAPRYHPVQQAYYGYLDRKVCMLGAWMQGEHVQRASDAQCEQVGKVLAQLHIAACQIDSDLLESFSHASPAELAFSWMQVGPFADITMAQYESCEQLRRILDHPEQQALLGQLPSGLIHADLFRDNVLFVGDKIHAVLDFSAAIHSAYSYDIAVAINDFCVDAATNTICPQRMQALLAGYERQRLLSVAEKQSLAVMMACAACYFALGRIHAKQTAIANNYSEQQVCLKEPEEMFMRLRQALDVISVQA